jgi:hypothetical protein
MLFFVGWSEKRSDFGYFLCINFVKFGLSEGFTTFFLQIQTGTSNEEDKEFGLLEYIKCKLSLDMVFTFGEVTSSSSSLCRSKSSMDENFRFRSPLEVVIVSGTVNVLFISPSFLRYVGHIRKRYKTKSYLEIE